MLMHFGSTLHGRRRGARPGEWATGKIGKTWKRKTQRPVVRKETEKIGEVEARWSKHSWRPWFDLIRDAGAWNGMKTEVKKSWLLLQLLLLWSEPQKSSQDTYNCHQLPRSWFTVLTTQAWMLCLTGPWLSGKQVCSLLKPASATCACC